MPSEDLERILDEQAACAEYLALHPGDRGATLGMADWVCEEIISTWRGNVIFSELLDRTRL